jgi:hypothetical protein
MPLLSLSPQRALPSAPALSRLRKSLLRLLLVAPVLLLFVAACTEPLELADWEITLPEGTPVHEYAFVPEDERSVSEEHKRAIVADLAERIEGLAYQHFHWPERYATIEALEIDGHGNVYVFPHAPSSRRRDDRDETDSVPVDVYDADGTRIFTGWSDIPTWDTVHSDAIYRIEVDPASGEQVVARYRLSLEQRRR